MSRIYYYNSVFLELSYVSVGHGLVYQLRDLIYSIRSVHSAIVSDYGGAPPIFHSIYSIPSQFSITKLLMASYSLQSMKYCSSKAFITYVKYHSCVITHCYHRRMIIPTRKYNLKIFCSSFSSSSFLLADLFHHYGLIGLDLVHILRQYSYLSLLFSL